MYIAGACLAQIGSGCQPAIRDTLLSGIESSIAGLVGTFIQAFFQSLQSTPNSTSQPVVQALMDHLPKLV